MGNFEFLKDINTDLANLGETAEKLFRDEYFDQCISQTRKMAEAMTRTVLGSKAQADDTFDDMIYKLKTVSDSTFQEQEFISDMYFLKKQGNIAVHSVNSQNDGKTALECLEHAFEAAINFAYSKTCDEKINKLIFDEQLLVLGEKNKTLQEQYKQELKKSQSEKSAVKKNEKKEKSSKTMDFHLNKIEKEESFKKPSFEKFFFKKFAYFAFIVLIIALSAVFVSSQISSPANAHNQKAKKAKKNILRQKTLQKSNYKYTITETFSSF